MFARKFLRILLFKWKGGLVPLKEIDRINRLLKGFKEFAVEVA